MNLGSVGSKISYKRKIDTHKAQVDSGQESVI